MVKAIAFAARRKISLVSLACLINSPSASLDIDSDLSPVQSKE
jgi:hypothetical protein